MTKGTNTVTLRDIQKIVQQIVAYCHPQKVILFGSYAHGTPTADSDVDLLVIMETEEPPLHAAARIAATIDHPCALDILVRRPADLEASLARQGVFATEVLTTGVVLYEA
jgi:predicted nucleotidyltransferase